MFSGMKVGVRLGLGFAWVVLLLVLVTGFGLYNMDQMQRRFVSAVSVNSLESRLVVEMNETVMERAISLRNLMLQGGADDIEKEAAYIKAQTKLYFDAEQKLRQMFDSVAVVSPEEKAALTKIKTQADIADKLTEQAVDLGLKREAYELAQFLKEQYLPAQKKWQMELSALDTLERHLVEQAARDSNAAYDKARWMMLILSAVGIVTALMTAVSLTRHLLRKLGGEPDYAVIIAGRIADGDLAVQIDTKRGDKDSLLMAMKVMRDKLAGIVSQVRAGAGSISNASTEIAQGNLNLSTRTEQQAGSLEETASSMEQLNSAVKQNAESAQQANQLAVTASDVAVQGGTIVSEVVETMESINASSQKVVDIISVIDGIAFQTNILALNAAVEAARAGEQGRGFAVVASEVRNLAQRSASAAKEIKVLISDSVDKVENGSRLVERAGVAMTDIVTSIRRVTDVMSEITNANAEQSSGIEQVNNAIIQIDDMTQQNAALVEQAAAAAKQLQDQAGGLAQLVSVFKLGSDAFAAPQERLRNVVDITPTHLELPQS